NRWSAHPKCLVILLIVPIYELIYSHDLHVTSPHKRRPRSHFDTAARRASRSRSSQGFCQEFRIEHEYRRGTPPCRSAVQERTAVARGPASNDRVQGRTAGDARKDRALAGASVGSRRRQSENADRALIVETLARLRSRSCRREATISQRHSGVA